LFSLGRFSEKRSNGGLVSTANAEGGGCSLATLQGEYLVTGQAQARLDQSDDPSYPRRGIEVYNFDGEGHMSSFFTNNNGGTIGRGTGTVTYTVDPERCTAILTFAAGFQFEWFLARDGSAGEAVRVDVDKVTGKAVVATRSMKWR
jgi:hypothetical protein